MSRCRLNDGRHTGHIQHRARRPRAWMMARHRASHAYTSGVERGRCLAHRQDAAMRKTAADDAARRQAHRMKAHCVARGSSRPRVPAPLQRRPPWLGCPVNRQCRKTTVVSSQCRFHTGGRTVRMQLHYALYPRTWTNAQRHASSAHASAVQRGHCPVRARLHSQCARMPVGGGDANETPHWQDTRRASAAEWLALFSGHPTGSLVVTTARVLRHANGNSCTAPIHS